MVHILWENVKGMEGHMEEGRVVKQEGNQSGFLEEVEECWQDMGVVLSR